MQFFLCTAVYFVSAFCISMLTARLRNRKPIKILFLPGFLVNGIARIVGSFLSLSPIEKVEFFQNNKPFLKVGKTRILYVGHLFSVYATHIVLLVTFLLLQDGIPVTDWSAFCFPNIKAVWSDFSLLWDYFVALPEAVDMATTSFWLTLYLFVSLAVSFDMKLPEFLATICVNMIGCWVAGIFSWLGVSFSFFSRGWFIELLYADGWWGVGCFYMLMTALSATVFLLAYGLFAMTRIYFKKKLEKQCKKKAAQKNLQKQQG